MTGKIYLLQENGALQGMIEQPYADEDLLQTLLEKYPDLLAGDQVDEASPRRWLLVSREVGVPGEEEGAGRWSLDHLFLDQDAVPTLVEVKRSSDTRIRREVVGQMLDYAANAVVYWPVETIRAKFEAACDQRGDDPAQLVAALTEAEPGDEAAVETFWGQVKTNLQAEKVRLVFVADDIPPELRRIVEFLNGQMDPAEVLAVAIKQYVGQGIKTLVPKIIGLTAEARNKGPAKSFEKRQWDEASFLDDLGTRGGASQVAIAKKLLEWTRSKELRIWWGKGKHDGSFFPMLDYQGMSHWLIAVWTYGRVEIQFGRLQNSSPFDAESKHVELLNRLNALSGVAFPDDAITRRPSALLSTFKNEAVLKQFFKTIDWVIEEIKASGQ